MKAFKTIFGFLFLLLALYVNAQSITGTVFTDSNNNGVLDSGEIGLPNATITAYSTGNTVIATAISSNTGTYTLSGLASGSKYRVEFVPFAGFTDGAIGGSNLSSVQFITAGSSNVNFGIFLPGKCGTDPDPRIIGTCGLFNNPSVDTTVASWRYNTDFYPQTQWEAFTYTNTIHPHEGDMAAGEIGVPWAMARIPGTNYVLNVPVSSPAVGVFATGGVAGTSAVYMADYSNANASYSSHKLLVKLSDFGINLSAVYPIGADQPRFGEYGLGGLTVSADAKYIYVANLGKANLIRIDISGVNYASLPSTAPGAAQISEISYPSTFAGFTSGIDGYFRATALKQFGGDIYIAGTFDGSLRSDNSAVRVVVLKMNPVTNAMTEVFNFNPMTFVVGNIQAFPIAQSRWTAGPDVNEPNGHKLIQPVVSGFDFDNYGAITLGITNRGVYNLQTNLETGYVVSTWRNADGTYTLESGGSRGPLTAANMGTTMHLITDTPAPGVTGPGLDVFYDQTISGHTYLFNGGVLNITRENVMAFGMTDAVGTGAFGVRYDKQTDGGIVGGIHIGGGKIYALVGVDAVCVIKDPVEVGNYVWRDTNNNGIQDGDEPALAGVTVELINNSGVVVATATTNSDGYYVFSSDPNRVSTSSHKYQLVFVAGANYKIRIPNTSGGSQQSTLSGLFLTSKDQSLDMRDSDGSTVGVNAEVSFVMGAEGQNDHTFDFGFGTVAAVTCEICPDELTIAGVVFGSGSAPLAEDVTTNGSNPLAENNIAGFRATGSSEGIFYTFCTMIDQPVLPIQNPYVRVANGAPNGFTTVQGEKLAKLFQVAGFNSATGFGAGNNTTTNMVAMQMAVWNVMYDTDYSVSSGSFQLLTDNNPGVRALSNSWLSAAQSLPIANTPVERLVHATGQDLIFQNCLSTEPSSCNIGTNNYSVSGHVFFANAPSTGTLTVSVSGGGSQVFNAPFTSPQAYTLSGLTSDGLSHTVTAVFSAEPTCSSTATYTAPTSCSVLCCIGTNLFSNGSIESGSYTANASVVDPNNADYTAVYETDVTDWERNENTYWVEDGTRATDGTRFMYLPSPGLCFTRLFDLNNEVSTCKQYKICMDVAAFDHTQPNGGSQTSGIILEGKYFSSDFSIGEDIFTIEDFTDVSTSAPLTNPISISSWNNITWRRVTATITLPPATVANPGWFKLYFSVASSLVVPSDEKGILLDNLCITEIPTTPLTVTCSKVDNSNCALPNGSASVTTNATNPSYIWNTGATTASISNLTNGSYTVTVTNTTTGCTNSCQAIVGSTTTLPTAACSKTDNTNCATPNGNASVVTNGNQILWSTGATTASISGLNAATYTVTVTNTTTGCTNSCQAVVGSTTTLPTATCSKTDNTNCATPNGSASVVTNGNQILWSTGATTTSISGLDAATYTVTVTNTTTGCMNTCQAIVANATVNPTCNITANTQPSCANLTGGSITVNPSPAGTYTYNWSDIGSGSASRTGLTGGTYTVTVTNTTTSCTGVCQITLTTPTNCCNISAVVPQNVVCYDNGTPSLSTDNRIRFSANITNTNTSLTSYNVSINGGTTITPNTNVPYGLTQFTLGPGTAGGGATFTVTVTDTATPGCTQTFQIVDPGLCSPGTSECPPIQCGSATIQTNGN